MRARFPASWVSFQEMFEKLQERTRLQSRRRRMRARIFLNENDAEATMGSETSLNCMQRIASTV